MRCFTPAQCSKTVDKTSPCRYVISSSLSLSSGDKLGPYEILGPLGAGGMGEVYRARDPRLGREVAIKVSAEKFNERFAREARVVASLNHPNICALYDVGPNYLVMELVEGQSPQGIGRKFDSAGPGWLRRSESGLSLPQKRRFPTQSTTRRLGTRRLAQRRGPGHPPVVPSAPRPFVPIRRTTGTSG